MFDSGTMNLFVDYSFVKKLCLKMDLLYYPLSPSMDLDWVCKGCRMNFDREGWKFVAKLIVVPRNALMYFRVWINWPPTE